MPKPTRTAEQLKAMLIARIARSATRRRRAHSSGVARACAMNTRAM